TRPPPRPTLFPYTTLFRSAVSAISAVSAVIVPSSRSELEVQELGRPGRPQHVDQEQGQRQHEPLARPADAAEARLEPFDRPPRRSEEHTSELQSRENLVCR